MATYRSRKAKFTQRPKIKIERYFAEIRTFCRKIVEIYIFFTTFVRNFITI